MKSLREIWHEILDGIKETLLPPAGSPAVVIWEQMSSILQGHGTLPPEEKIELWKKMAGIETEEEKAERTKPWAAKVRASLIEDGVSQTSLAVFDAFVGEKWPQNAIAAGSYWTALQVAKLASTGMVLGAEGAYELARDIRPARPDPAMAWKMFFTGGIDRARAVDALRDMGWSETYIHGLEKASQRYTEVGEIIALHRRGEIDVAGFYARMEKLGYEHASSYDMLKLKDLIPGPTDLVRMGLREAWRDDVAAKWGYDQDFPPEFATWMEKQGYSREWSKRYWRAHWVLPAITQGFEMFHRGVINNSELQELLKISDIPAAWRSRLTAVAYQPLTRVDVRRMHDMGVLGVEDVKRSYLDLGYDDLNAQRMTDFTIKYNEKVGDGDLTKYKDLTRSIIIQAYQKGILARDQVETRLMDLEYAAEEIEILLSLADWEKDVEEAPDYTAEYRRDIKGIVEKGYAQRIISHGEAMNLLLGVDFGEAEAAYVLTAVDFWWGMDQTAAAMKVVGEAYVSRGFNRADALDALGQFGIPSDMMQKKMNEWDIQRNIRPRRLTEAQYRKALGDDLISVAEYEENMRGLGYTDYDIWLLSAMAVGVEKAGSPTESGPLSLNER